MSDKDKLFCLENFTNMKHRSENSSGFANHMCILYFVLIICIMHQLILYLLSTIILSLLSLIIWLIIIQLQNVLSSLLLMKRHSDVTRVDHKLVVTIQLKVCNDSDKICNNSINSQWKVIIQLQISQMWFHHWLKDQYHQRGEEGTD